MVLRACPSPRTARPVPRGSPVGGHAPPPLGASRVASDLLCRHAIAITPVGPLVRVASRGVTPSSPVTAAFPDFTAGRLPHYAFRGLLGVHSRYGLPARGVAEATLCIEGSGGFVTSTAAPIATGWSDKSCRAGLAPAEDPRLFTAHMRFWRDASRPAGVATRTVPIAGRTCHIPAIRAIPGCRWRRGRLRIGRARIG